ncbi:ABC transporter ATP-binding protein [Litorivicinus lipolyticus]|uniref:ABC transporter ATP-binding protein n=1 Tax=Litorivicinus lipolyticus TaxID=418701 RepID=UPI003B5BAFDB
MSFLSIDGIHKTYAEAPVLSDINISVSQGEFLVLVGPSGCGKSTLLNMIAGLETVTQGAISIDGNDVTDVAPAERDIAMVFQSYALYPNMSVAENITFGLEMRGVPKAERLAACQAVAKTLQIEQLLHRKPSALSGGQRQRVAMGRALVRDPLVFLFDEPLSNLDAKLRVDMRTEIKRLHQSMGTTIVYVTHDQIEAMTLATRIAVMNGGIVQQLGTPNEIYTRPANLFVATFMGSPSMNLLDVEVADDGHCAIATSNQTLALATGLPAGRYTLGLRAEHLTDESLADPNANSLRFTAVVDVVEPAGSDTFVVTQFGGRSFTARMRGDLLVNPGDTVTLAFDSQRLHFFDRTSGERVSGS